MHLYGTSEFVQVKYQFLRHKTFPLFHIFLFYYITGSVFL